MSPAHATASRRRRREQAAPIRRVAPLSVAAARRAHILTAPRPAAHHRPVANPPDSEQADADAALPHYVRGLLDPAAYPHRPPTVELVQTHISSVFIAGDFVYKTKKPVDFGFIDQTAPEARERFCTPRCG